MRQSTIEKPNEVQIFSWDHLEPEPVLDCAQFAEKHIILSRKAGNSDPGLLRISERPHMLGPLRAYSNPAIKEITLKFSAQAAKTTIIFCIIAYIVSQNPDPIAIVLPKAGNVKTWRDVRLKSIIDDTPIVAAHKTGKEDDMAGDVWLFDNMFIKFVSSGSPSELAEIAARTIIQDEKNKQPEFSGKEASPDKLIKNRAETFLNRIFINASTPTLKGIGISNDFARSDQRELYAQCPLCKEYQVLTFFKDMGDVPGSIRWPDGATSEEVMRDQSAWYECGHCQGRIEESQRLNMGNNAVEVQKGAKIDKNGVISGAYDHIHYGLKVWRIYVKFRSFSDVAAEFLSVKDRPADLMDFYNSWLCEEWDEMPDAEVNSDAIHDRCEGYGPELPDGVLMLTAWFDTQGNRLEGEVVGWGKNDESWSIEYVTIEGDPGHPETWNELDEKIYKKVYRTSRGVEMRITGAGNDVQGHNFVDVCNFCRPRHRRVNGPRVFATQGANVEANKPLKSLVLEPTRKNKGRVSLYNMDTSSLKKTVFHRLKIKEHGPKYMHFPVGYDQSYFMGLAESERLKRVTKKSGYSKVEWVKDPAIPNEPLDCRVGNMAVLYILRPNFDAIERVMNQRIAEIEAGVQAKPIKRRSGLRVISKGVEV